MQQLIACQGIYELIMGRVDEVIFVMVILVLNLSTWAYLMGTISGNRLKNLAASIHLDHTHPFFSFLSQGYVLRQMKALHSRTR